MTDKIKFFTADEIKFFEAENLRFEQKIAKAKADEDKRIKEVEDIFLQLEDCFRENENLDALRICECIKNLRMH